MSEIKDPDLSRLEKQARAVTTEVERLFRERTPAQLTWRWNPEAWSIAECVMHLHQTGAGYYPVLARGIERSRSRGKVSRGPFRPTWLGGKVIRAMEPGTSRKFKAPSVFQPIADAGVDSGPKFVAQQEELYRLLEQADGLDLNGQRVVSPASKLIRLTLGEGLTLIVTHQRRHLAQALAVSERRGYPSGD